MALQCEALANRSEARQERLRAFGITKTTHAALAFTRRLVAAFSAVVNPGTGFDGDVHDVGQLRDLGLCRRMAAQLVSHDLAWRLGTSGKHALEKPLGCSLVPTFPRTAVSRETCRLTKRSCCARNLINLAV